VAPRQSFGGVQFVASVHATQTPLPVQSGMPTGHALSVCVCPSSEQVRTMPAAQVFDLATHWSHSSAWLSQRPVPHVATSTKAD
jgi:hypothetical protein